MNDLTKLYMNVVKVNQRLLEIQASDVDRFRRSESSLFKAVTQATTHQTPFGTPAMTQKFGGDGAINTALEGMYDRIKPAGQKKKNHIRRINQSKVTEHTFTQLSLLTPHLELTKWSTYRRLYSFDCRGESYEGKHRGAEKGDYQRPPA